MARMNISVPEEMRAEITRLGEKVNWSSVAQEAFAREIARLSRPKESTMESVIERLRESKRRYLGEVAEFGKERGRRWAETSAEWEELVRIAHVDEPDHNDDWAVNALLKEVLVEDNLEVSEILSAFGIEREELTEDFARAFIAAAREVYEEVKDKI